MLSVKKRQAMAEFLGEFTSFNVHQSLNCKAGWVNAACRHESPV